MTAFFTIALHDGTLWVLLACVVVVVGVGVGLFTRTGSGINAHPYPRSGDGVGLATDMPAEATGREELAALLTHPAAGDQRTREDSNL
jgi:hypothetical protein